MKPLLSRKSMLISRVARPPQTMQLERLDEVSTVQIGTLRGQRVQMQFDFLKLRLNRATKSVGKVQQMLANRLSRRPQ